MTRHGMKIQATYEDITSLGNSVPSTKTSLEEETTQKVKEKGNNALEAEATLPGRADMCLGYEK